MEPITDLSNRHRPGPLLLRFGLCALVALALFLAGRATASVTDAGARSSREHATGREHLAGQPLAPPTTVAKGGEWCGPAGADDDEDAVVSPDDSWTSVSVEAGGARAELRHPGSWREFPVSGVPLTLVSEDSAIGVYLEALPAGLTPEAFRAEARARFWEVLPGISLERTEPSILDGEPACRGVGQMVESGEIADVELWLGVADEGTVVLVIAGHPKDASARVRREARGVVGSLSVTPLPA